MPSRASSPWQHLPIWLLSNISWRLLFTSPHVLSHRRLCQCCSLLPLRGHLCLIQVVLLPLAAGPRDMPHQPQPDTPIVRSVWLSTELPMWLSNTSLIEGWLLHVQQPPTFHWPPHYRMGSFSYQLLGGCAPWPGQEGWVLICSIATVHGLQSLATFSSFMTCL
jgi:hypothetical protein